MKFQLNALAILASSIFLSVMVAQAQTPGKPVKIGILSDMSSLYAD
jgi:hypothetical protein